MWTYLGETLLLQVGNDALPKEIRRADNVQHFFMVVAQKGELEAILGGVNSDGTRPG